jgi:DNA-directed RNA polymerase subunit RPC12/RpoP
MDDMNTENVNEEVATDTTKIVQTDVNAKDGQDKCPSCGATDISLNIKTGHLRCNFCRHEFDLEEADGLEKDISKIEGRIIGSGASNISVDSEDMVTLKCDSCGAEVVIDTSEVTHARCHWCRNTLSIKQKIPNGAIPDVVLPFSITKDVAKAEIDGFVNKRKFFAHPQFTKEFSTENVMGVYFPYMVVDINAHANLAGQGEHLVRTYTRGSDKNKKRYYDADLYNVERDFDLLVAGLTVESNALRLHNASDKTNNIINAIMPFDIENCTKWNANYLRNYSSEKRDINVDQLSDIVQVQTQDIARHSMNKTLAHYDRGVAWSSEQVDIKGEQWKAAYLPVWLYSYQQVNGSKSVLHYVAVNARTKEIMGSVPMDMTKLFGVSAGLEVAGAVLWFLTKNAFDYAWVFFFIGFIFAFLMHLRYRNSNARHKHETETNMEVKNLREEDIFIKKRTGLSNSKMSGANNTQVRAKR